MAKVSDTIQEFSTQNLADVPKVGGVYAFFYKDICLYVGMTGDLNYRVGTHLGRHSGPVANRVIYYWVIEEGEDWQADKKRRRDFEKTKTKELSPLWLQDKEEFSKLKPLITSDNVDFRTQEIGTKYEDYLVTDFPNPKVIGKWGEITLDKHSLAPYYFLGEKQVHLDDLIEEIFGIKHYSMSLPEVYLDHLHQFVLRNMGKLPKEFMKNWYTENYGCEFCGQTTKNVVKGDGELNKLCKKCDYARQIKELRSKIVVLKTILETTSDEDIDLEEFWTQFKEWPQDVVIFALN